MSYNPQKHHRRSIRLPEYNYRQPGAYFITICTYKKQCWLGDVVKGTMHCNHLGYIVSMFWQDLSRRFSHITIDVFVVMPNHIHGILILTDKELYVSQKEQFGKPVSGSIPTVVRSFKSTVSKRINRMRRESNPPFWQRNYYESIIRIEGGLDRVRQYIRNNPRRWDFDEETPRSDPNYGNNLYELNLYF
ncbi:MAG: transposase [Cyanobacteriota bacterium]|nr:transposase [Cyanobacteriota bacterium]